MTVNLVQEAVTNLPDLISRCGGQAVTGRAVGEPRRNVWWWVHKDAWPKRETRRKLVDLADRLNVKLADEFRAKLLVE